MKLFRDEAYFLRATTIIVEALQHQRLGALYRTLYIISYAIISYSFLELSASSCLEFYDHHMHTLCRKSGEYSL